MNHYCNNSACPEYNHGQCFGGGCKLNPMPAPSEPDAHYLYDDDVPFAEDGDNDSDE